MASAFGWTVEEVEQNVVFLIQSGRIEGRVDSQNKVRNTTLVQYAFNANRRLKVLHAKQTDFRADLFGRAIKAGKDIQLTNRKLLLRMGL
jgi:COP9 signalosome complex subunit 1